MSSKLDALRQYSKIVCDTGDPALMQQFGAVDATTNPTLILQSAQNQSYQDLLNEAVFWGVRQNENPNQTLAYVLDKIQVNIGVEILKQVPGRVSTELDPRLSFDTDAMVQRAEFLMKLYESVGVARDRILIKIPATWEGIKAVEILEKKNIKCNVTLVFNLVQAVAAADAGATLISPFVGRIYDWWIAAYGRDGYSIDKDPGVASVKNIYTYFKYHRITTEVMAASFRTVDQILALAGCDLLTISPKLLQELQSQQGSVECCLKQEDTQAIDMPRLQFSEATFRYLMNDDAMATEKLAEGIRIFASDTQVLEAAVTEFIKQQLPK